MPRLAFTRTSLVVATAALIASPSCNLFQPPPPPQAVVPISGRVSLPDGASIDMQGLHVDTALGNAPVSADGSFTAQTTTGAGALIILRNAAGKAMLFGTAGGGPNAAPGEISAGSTAVVLIYLALGAFVLPPELKQQVLAAIGDHPAAGKLAMVVAARVAANPTAIEDADPELLAAITQAAADVAAAPPPVRARVFDPIAVASPRAARLSKPYNLQNSDPPLSLLQVDPAGGVLQSGAEVVQNPSGTGVIATNHLRRRGHVFAYKTATEDDDGKKMFLDTPQLVGDVDFPTTQGLSSVSLSITGIPTLLYDIATQTSPWAPVSTSPIELTAEAGARKTFFDVIVIGAALPASSEVGPFNLAAYSNYVPQWRIEQRNAALKTCIIDIVIPILATLWDVRALQVSKATADTAIAEVEALMTRSLPQFLELTRDVQYAKAVELLFTEIGRNPEFAVDLLVLSSKFIAEAELLLANKQAIALQMSQRLQNSTILFAVNAALTAGDLGAVIKDHATVAGAETWNVLAVFPTARITPNKSDVNTGDVVTLMASLNGTSGLTLRYKWSTTGMFGRIGDGAGNSGVEFETDVAGVGYLANSDAPDGSKDTISVDVLQVVSEGVTRKLASATAEVTVRVNQNCDELDTAPYTSGCGNLSISPMEVTAGDIVTVTAFAGCGGARLACDYADPDSVEVDGVSVPGNAGYPSLYSYDPPRPGPRYNGASVQLSNGPHTVKFRIKLTAPNDCLNIVGSSAVGPWVIMGGGSPNTWSSVGHFRVRQSGL